VPSLAHLVWRFAGSLSPRPPSRADESWAESHLSEAERLLWRSMSNPDRRHAIGVARRTIAALDDDLTRPVVAAALLHDAGKVVAGLGTFGRVEATLWSMVRGRSKASAGEGAVARYLRHDELGADLLEQAGSDALIIAWTREHHRPASSWSVAPELAHVLKAADGD